MSQQESATDGRGRKRALHQVYCSGVQLEERATLAVGEYLSYITSAYDSVLHVLERPKPSGMPDLPVTWRKVNPYSEMLCSGCGKLKSCMRSGKAWMKVAGMID